MELLAASLQEGSCEPTPKTPASCQRSGQWVGELLTSQVSMVLNERCVDIT